MFKFLKDKKANSLKVENSTTRSFNYTAGKVSLKFSLRIDIKGDLKDFMTCLEAAVKDVQSELNNFE